jgi:hypothetical protein
MNHDGKMDVVFGDLAMKNMGLIVKLEVLVRV